MTKRRILIIIPSLKGGGAERVLLNFLERIDLNRFEITLVVVLYSGIYITQIPKGIKVIPLFKLFAFERLLSFLHKRYRFLFPYWLIVKLKIHGSYDVGISFQDSNYTDLLFFIDKVKRKLCWVHSSLKSNPNYIKYIKDEKYRQSLINKRYSKIDQVIFVSQTAKMEFVDRYGNVSKYRVINNIINSNGILQKSTHPLPFKKEKFTFIAVGNLLPVKGYSRLIRSSKLLKDKGYIFEVLIIGEGPDRKRLINLCTLLQLNEQVKFPGFIENPYPLVKNSDVYIMTSISEAMPTALCEAFILGKPVVVTRCAACEEFTENGKYALVAEQDDESLTSKMELLLVNEEIRRQYMLLSNERGRMFYDKSILEEYYSVLIET